MQDVALDVTKYNCCVQIYFFFTILASSKHMYGIVMKENQLIMFVMGLSTRWDLIDSACKLQDPFLHGNFSLALSAFITM